MRAFINIEGRIFLPAFVYYKSTTSVLHKRISVTYIHIYKHTNQPQKLRRKTWHANPVHAPSRTRRP